MLDFAPVAQRYSRNSFEMSFLYSSPFDGNANFTYNLSFCSSLAGDDVWSLTFCDAYFSSANALARKVIAVATLRHPHSGHSSLVFHAADEVVDLADFVRLHDKVVGIAAGKAAPFLVGADEVFASHADTPIREVKRSFSVIRMMSLNCFTRSALML